MTYKNQIKTVFAVMLVWQFAVSSLSAQVTYIWDYESLTALKSNPNNAESQRIIKTAKGKLGEKPVAVTQKKNSVSGDKHNYESLAVYFWKDEKNPKGKYVERDGQFNPESNNYDYPRLLKMEDNVRYLAQAFFLTEDNAFYECFCAQLDSWFIDPATCMNPNMEYAQFAPGWNNNKGFHGGIIDARSLCTVLDCVRLVNSVKSIGKARQKALVAWYKSLAKWLTTSENGKGEDASLNNHGICYDYNLYNIFLFINDKRDRKKILKNFYEKRILPQIQSDGSQPLELKRTCAFAYSVLNLSFIDTFCTMAERDGQDCSVIRERYGKGLDFLAPYIGNKDKFPYTEIGNWENSEQTLKTLIRNEQNRKNRI